VEASVMVCSIVIVGHIRQEEEGFAKEGPVYLK
jgi:hypothetical protein